MPPPQVSNKPLSLFQQSVSCKSSNNCTAACTSSSPNVVLPQDSISSTSAGRHSRPSNCSQAIDRSVSPLNSKGFQSETASSLKRSLPAAMQDMSVPKCIKLVACPAVGSDSILQSVPQRRNAFQSVHQNESIPQSCNTLQQPTSQDNTTSTKDASTTSNKNRKENFSTSPASVKQKSSKGSPCESLCWSDARHADYMIENREKLISLIGKAAEIVCIVSHHQSSQDQNLNALAVCIQFSLATVEPGTNGLYHWESFVIPHHTKTVSHALQCVRSIVLLCCDGTPLFNDAKATFRHLIDSKILAETDVQSLKFNDICLASWLLKSDSFCKEEVYPKLMKPSSAKAAKTTLEKFKQLSAALEDQGMENVYKLELSIVPILVIMECRGIAVDEDELDRVDLIMSREIKALEKKAGVCIGSPVSLNSTLQLRQVLYERLKLDKQLPKSTLYKTAKGQQTSTSESVLSQLVPHHPLPRIILDYRQVYKIQSTYITAVRGYVTEGVIRTQWHQTSVSTGRVQSTKPNIQAVPKSSLTFADETGMGVTVCPRSIYKSREGYTFISVDFKQVELRVFAHITSDKKLVKLFQEDHEDIFRNLSSIWTNKDVDAVTQAEREKTKKIVYSVMYGVGKCKLSQHLNITPMEAQNIMSRFLQDFPRVQQFRNEMVMSCREKGYAESILGRRRILENITSKDFKDRTHAERQAVNFTIQGSASDICKLVMQEISIELQKSSVSASLLLQIHDELLYEVMDTHIEMAKAIFIKCMETDGGAWYAGLQLRVPLRIALKSGKNWAAMNPL